MLKAKQIITIGVSPSWDVTCIGHGIEWGSHMDLIDQRCVPAGKALNVSRALAWQGRESIAAGLWGASDYPEMLDRLESISNLVDVRFTRSPGQTRHNITIIDDSTSGEIHLRAPGKLATSATMKQLGNELKEMVSGECVCVFAGSVGADILEEWLELIYVCSQGGAEIVIDTSGAALKEAVGRGGATIIKPNLEELCDLLEDEIQDETAQIAAAARGLCDKVSLVVVSRGSKGAMAVTSDEIWDAKLCENRKTHGTVGCGDYMLAGMIDGLINEAGIPEALENAIKIGAFRAWGETIQKNLGDVADTIATDVSRLD